jgi:ribose 1,5-bisphosphokinase PhnN
MQAIDALRCVRVLRPDRLAGVPDLRSLTFVGAMCAGKSSVASAIATHRSTSQRCELAARITTREPRRSDSREDIAHLTWEEFDRRRAAGDLALSWVRPLPDGDAIGYGCEHVTAGKIALHLAGHGVYTNPDSVQPDDVLSHTVIVAVFASPDRRRERARRRSPDIGPDRLSALMVHDDERMLAEADVLIDNDSDDPAPALADAVTLAQVLFDASAAGRTRR